MLLQVLAYLPAVIGITALSILVLVKNLNSHSNKFFALLGISISIWLLMLFFSDTATNSDQALFYMRTAQTAACLFPLFFIYFSYAFPSTSPPGFLKGVLLALPALILLPFSYSDLMIVGVEISKYGAIIDEFGPLYVVLTLYALSYLALGLLMLIYKKRKLGPKQKTQINIVVTGIIIALFANVVTGYIFVLLQVSGAFVLLGGFSLFIFASFVTYAMVKHRLFDIRLIIARSLAYILVLITLGVIYGFIVFGIMDRFFADAQTTAIQQVIYTLSAVFLAFTFQPFKRYFDRLTDSVFYRDRYNTEDVLNRLGKVFVAKSNSFELLDESLIIISDTLKAEFARFIVVDNNKVHKTAHIGSHEDLKVSPDAFANFKNIIGIYDEFNDESKQQVLRDINAYAVVRLETRNNLVGYLVLGAKRSGTIFTKQDINFLEILSQELAVAIQNAKSYEEIQAFSETLKKEVDEATAQLRETNKRLVKLDEAKDEFISMASHQLRTPLTTIKGYLSMLLDGDAGKIPKKQKEFIDLAFVSSQRMVHLISDMLNVSRISTGRLTIDKGSLDLAAVVESELEQLHRQAEAHGVDLRLHRPDEPINIELDENKIRQVIMNFTDNAIYYSPEGTVDVTVEEKDGFAEFRVEDNGIGVSEEAQKQLFTKFFRAENAQAVRPDGTGLGLYMAKQVIEAQDGEIIFKSKEGEGSTFGFRFKLGDKKDTDD